MRDLYPGYDVLSKRDTPSWNDKTREVVQTRLSVGEQDHAFCTSHEWRTLEALCHTVLPQPDSSGRRSVPVAALLDRRLCADDGDGYRQADMPDLRTAWRRGLAALDAEAQARRGRGFADLDGGARRDLVDALASGSLDAPQWEGMNSGDFFKHRVLPDLLKLYYAHPTAWSEIGWGGPASPRGYVRMRADRRDSWEAAEAKPGHEEYARRENSRVGR